MCLVRNPINNLIMKSDSQDFRFISPQAKIRFPRSNPVAQESTVTFNKLFILWVPFCLCSAHAPIKVQYVPGYRTSLLLPASSWNTWYGTHSVGCLGGVEMVPEPRHNAGGKVHLNPDSYSIGFSGAMWL